MPTFLFHELIFGPVKSRRLGVSLGINLLPRGRKVCNFNCIYCECGWTQNIHALDNDFPSLTDIEQALSNRLTELKKLRSPIDAITFAGNGEPTLHPFFPEVMDLTIRLRNVFYPQARIAVLSNASRITRNDIFESLKKADMNILKLDAGSETTCLVINQPAREYRRDITIQRLKEFQGKVIIQSMFFRGVFNHQYIDNTLEAEIMPWYEAIQNIIPQLVMIYTIERDTPVQGLNKIPPDELKNIAKKINAMGIKTQISG